MTYSAISIGSYEGVGNPIGVPGSNDGPCKTCAHLVCGAARKRADRECVHCGKPIGFTASYSITRGDEYTHTSCRSQHRERIGLAELEDKIVSAIDVLPISREAYTAAVRHAIEHAGFVKAERRYGPVRAEVDRLGNCDICGEAGRCPGYHIHEDDYARGPKP